MTPVLATAAWTVVGFLAGYWFARTASDALLSGEPAMATRHRRLWHSLDGRAIAGLLILVMLAVTATGGYLTFREDRAELRQTEDRVACQAEFNGAFARALAERNESAAAERAAQRDLLMTLLGTDDEVESQAAIERYLAALDEADTKRAANPLPDRVDCREADG